MNDYSFLVNEAFEAQKMAKPTYSNFHVGAALLTKDNKIIRGCNIEVSSYSLTLCAERTAIFKAISDGITEFKAIAVVSDFKGFCSPCGACRQVIYDLCGNIDVVLADHEGNIKVLKALDFLPYPFDDSNLK